MFRRLFFILGLIVATSAAQSAEVSCLAKVIYHEARGGSELQQVTTAFTAINRSKHAKFPDSVCKVIAQPGQFPWYRNQNSIREKTAYQNSIKLAERVLSGDYKDPTNGALFFHAKTINPRWGNLRKIYSDGLHIFYTFR